MFQAELLDLRCRWAGERYTSCLAGLGKGRILAQKTVARMNDGGTCPPGGFKYAVSLQIGIPRSGRANGDGLICVLHMLRETVRLGKDRNRAQPERAGGADDAAGDLAAVCDENGSCQSHISSRIGVGLYALHGLFSCGQFEMSATTSRSACIST